MNRMSVWNMKISVVEIYFDGIQSIISSWFFLQIFRLTSTKKKQKLAKYVH